MSIGNTEESAFTGDDLCSFRRLLYILHHIYRSYLLAI